MGLDEIGTYKKRAVIKKKCVLHRSGTICGELDNKWGSNREVRAIGKCCALMKMGSGTESRLDDIC